MYRRFALLLLGPVAAFAAEHVEIRVLSNRADLISGGDALVELVVPAEVATSSLRVDVDGRDMTAAFALRATGRFMGLVDGLNLGTNVLTVRGTGAPLARMTITNHAIGGPIFAGPQVQPWICRTEQNGFGPPQDERCNIPTKYEFFYRSTNPLLTGFLAYDPANPPLDVATTTTDRGDVVPYIVRRETGVMDRGWYSLAVLFDPRTVWTPWQPQRGWNGKIVWPFGGSSSPDHYQNDPPAVLNDGQLSKGFMVAASSLNTHGQNLNDVVSAEVMMMIKEHIVERYGEIRYVIGEGCSGGALLQQMHVNAYPGLLNGIQPQCSFPDNRSTSSNAEARDCLVLDNYFNKGSPHLWTAEPQRAAVLGHASSGTCTAILALFGENTDPTRGCGGDNTEPWIYDPETNPGGTRCTGEDYQVAIWGRRSEDGFARRPWSNEGLQYGLVALQSGRILPEQFVDLNEKVGGLDIDGKFIRQRSSGDLEAFPIAYRTGRVNDGLRMDQVPIIDLRPSSNFEFHNDVNTYITRERLLRANGHADNQVVFTAPGPLVMPPEVTAEALRVIDQWLAAIEADTSADPLEVKVLRHKPPAAVDSCYIGGQKITDQARCRAAFPVISTTARIAAGGPLANDVLRCQPKPLSRVDYNVTFTDGQWARLQAVFPNGVCDWSQPPVGDAPSQQWITFADGPGGRPLGDAPRSEPFHVAPDLAAGPLSLSKNRVNGGDQVTFSALASNVGSADAASVVVRFLVDGVPLGADRTIASLAPNASVEVSSPAWSAKHQTGQHTVQVLLDPRNSIKELSESNNSTSATFRVEGNKLRNGSFEESANGASPDAWTSSGSTAYENGGADGARSVSTQPGGAWSSEPVAVTPGTSYLASVQVAGSGGTFVIQQFAPDGTLLAAISLPLPVTTVVESVGMTVALLAGATRLRVVLIGGALGKTTFDNVELIGG